jgi:hypothetical protein
MRVAFFALLLVNLVVFAWSQWLSPAADQPAPGATASAGAASATGPGRILLASERPPNASAPAGSAAPAGGAVAPADAGLSDVSLEGAGTATAAAAGLASVPAGAAGAGGAAAGTAAGPGTAAPEAQRCVSMGPFSELELTAQATAMLKQDGYQPRQRPANGPVPDGYMVLIGPLPNEAGQARVVRRLNRGGLDDAFALPKLDEGYAVSAGLFSARQRAERRVVAVERMGLKASVVERTRPGTVYWIDFDLKTPAGAAGAADPLLKPSDPSQKWQVVPCPEARPVG